MVAKIAGKRCGSAKKANITMVSAAPLADKKVYRSWEGALDGLVQTYDDIRKKQLNGKAVINMSISFRAEDPTDISVQERLFFSALARLITEFARLDVIIVAAAGNGRAVSKVFPYAYSVHNLLSKCVRMTPLHHGRKSSVPHFQMLSSLAV